MEKYMAAVEAGVAAFIFGSDQPGMLAPTGSIGKDTPAIGLAYEHAARIRRQLRKGPCARAWCSPAPSKPSPPATSSAKSPAPILSQGWIVACGHYDGHDICQGAGDNAAGSAVVMEAARLLAPLREHLQAGIRFVLFSGEELGLYGSYAYAAAHAGEMDTIRADISTRCDWHGHAPGAAAPVQPRANGLVQGPAP